MGKCNEARKKREDSRCRIVQTENGTAGFRQLTTRFLLSDQTSVGFVRQATRRLMRNNGGLLEVVQHSIPELMRRYGLSRTAAQRLKLAVELGVAAVMDVTDEKPIQSAEAVYVHLSTMAFSTQEEFVVLGLNSKNRIVVEGLVARGGGNLCAVTPRDVLLPLMLAGAMKGIVAHNHPSGDPTASEEDVVLTRRLVEAGEVVGVPIVDHVIIGRGRFESLREAGLMMGLGRARRAS